MKAAMYKALCLYAISCAIVLPNSMSAAASGAYEFRHIFSKKALVVASSGVGLYLLKRWYTSRCVAHTNHDAQEYTIATGLKYRRVVLTEPSSCIVHQLIADPRQVHIVLSVAHDTCVGAERPSHMAQRHQALAAINGGFFDYGVSSTRVLLIKLLECFGLASYDAFPIYALKIKGQWLSLSSKVSTGVLAWGERELAIGTAKTCATLHINKAILPVIDLNKRDITDQIIYTSAYGAPTPDTEGTSVIVRNSVVHDIVRGGGIDIEQGSYVYFMRGTFPNTIKAGDAAQLEICHETTDPHLENALIRSPYVIGSTPLLVHNGTVPQSVAQGTSPFFTKLHPRTAIGVLKDGTWLFVVVDGRCSHSRGISLYNLALYLQQRGCVNAINLDGGGSSTMVIRSEIVNSPSGREYAPVASERPGATALLVLPRQ